MTHSQGFRCKTRKVFSRDFRKHGRCATTVVHRVYHRGDYVTVHVDGSVHKGMPHRYYHGKTGTIFDVNPRSYGLEINKRVGTRIMKKRIYVRAEHIRPSKCAENHKLRVQQNEAQIKAFKEKKAQFVCLKRMPAMPREQVVISNPKITEIAPQKFEGIVV